MTDFIDWGFEKVSRSIACVMSVYCCIFEYVVATLCFIMLLPLLPLYLWRFYR